VRTVIVQLDWTIQQLFRSISYGFPGQACPRENGGRGMTKRKFRQTSLPRTVIVQLDWTIQQLFRSISYGFPGQACPRETCPHENGERGPGNDKKEIPIQ